MSQHHWQLLVWMRCNWYQRRCTKTTVQHFSHSGQSQSAQLDMLCFTIFTWLSRCLCVVRHQEAGV